MRDWRPLPACWKRTNACKPSARPQASFLHSPALLQRRPPPCMKKISPARRPPLRSGTWLFDASAAMRRKKRYPNGPVMKQRFSLSRFFMTLCLLFLVTLAGGRAKDAHAGNELSVAVLQNYPPFSYTDEQGKLTGFDVDFAAALCRQLRATCRTVALPLRAIIAGMTSQSLDMAVAGLGVTEERSRIMFFPTVTTAPTPCTSASPAYGWMKRGWRARCWRPSMIPCRWRLCARSGGARPS